jgi:hypothetical protein
MNKRYARDYDPSTLVVPLCEASRLKEERNLLAKAIAEMALKMGIYNGEVGLSGPQLLMLCGDAGDYSVHLEAENDKLDGLNAALALENKDIGDLEFQVKELKEELKGKVDPKVIFNSLIGALRAGPIEYCPNDHSYADWIEGCSEIWYNNLKTEEGNNV